MDKIARIGQSEVHSGYAAQFGSPSTYFVPGTFEAGVTRRISNGDLDTVKSESSCRKLPIPSELISQMRQLGEGEWIFRSEEGTPVNPGNALKRYVRPVAKCLLRLLDLIVWLQNSEATISWN